MTATAKTELVNTAMAHLGEPAFADITQDPPSAALAKVLAQLNGRAGVEQWAIARHSWLCCQTYATLTAAARAGNWRWPKVFDLPATAVKLYMVDGEGIEYEVGTDVVSSVVKPVIWSTEASLDVCYAEAKGFEAYSPDLLNVMAWELASRCAGPLQNDGAKAVKLHQNAIEALAMAQSGEAGQWGGEDPAIPSTFASLRLSAG
jgi:hypothetical protein